MVSAVYHKGGNVDANKASKPTRRERAKEEGPAKKLGTFIERNIQLAKCGDGILSLTDEEKLRLKFVLNDIEDGEEKCDNRNYDDDSVYIPCGNQYVLNDELKKLIDEIDKKLQEHEKTKFPIYSARCLEPRSDVQRQNAVNEEPGRDGIKPKIYTNDGNDNRRLKEVDKLLYVFKTSTDEIIDPLLDEDLQYLIEESRNTFSKSISTEQLQTVDNVGCDAFPSERNAPMTKEKMSELVTDAKNKMPNFKFRYEN